MEAGIYERAVKEKWVVLVPVSSEESEITNEFLLVHILKPVAGKENRYETLRGSSFVIVEDGKVRCEEGFENSRVSKILYTETYYDANYNPLRIVNISDPLIGGNASVPVLGGGNVVVTVMLGYVPQDDKETLNNIDSVVMASFGKRLEKFFVLMQSTFSVATIAKHGPLVKNRLKQKKFFFQFLKNETVSPFSANKLGS